MRVLTKLSWWAPFLGHITDVVASRNEKREIYMLTSFIEAHQIAQEKIVAFMGHPGGHLEKEDDEGDASELTPEEKTVLKESRELVVDLRIS